MNAVYSESVRVFRLVSIVGVLISAMIGACRAEEVILAPGAFVVPPGTQIFVETVVSLPIPREQVFESFVELEITTNANIQLEVGCFFDSEYFVLDNHVLAQGENSIKIDVTRGVAESTAAGAVELDIALVKRSPNGSEDESWFAVECGGDDGSCARAYYQSFPSYSSEDKSLVMSKRLRGEQESQTLSDERSTELADRSVVIAPNPFNPSTEIIFYNSVEEGVAIEVFDVRGSHIATVTRSVYPPGKNHVQWNGKNDSGMNVASGLYFVRVQKDSGIEVGRMLLMR